MKPNFKVIQIEVNAAMVSKSQRRSGYLNDPATLQKWTSDNREHPYQDLVRIFGYSVDGIPVSLPELYADVCGYTLDERDAEIAAVLLAESKRCGWSNKEFAAHLDRCTSAVLDVNDPLWSHVPMKDMRPDQYRK